MNLLRGEGHHPHKTSLVGEANDNPVSLQSEGPCTASLSGRRGIEVEGISFSLSMPARRARSEGLETKALKASWSSWEAVCCQWEDRRA